MAATSEQLHEMLFYCINFGFLMLEKAGDFYPFGATLSQEGKVAAAGASDGHERPPPTEVYELLGATFLAGAKNCEFLGFALAANVDIHKELEPAFKDGLRVHLEAAGYSRFIYAPYSLSASRDRGKKYEVSFGEMFSV